MQSLSIRAIRAIRVRFFIIANSAIKRIKRFLYNIHGCFGSVAAVSCRRSNKNAN